MPHKIPLWLSCLLLAAKVLHYNGSKIEQGRGQRLFMMSALAWEWEELHSCRILTI